MSYTKNHLSVYNRGVQATIRERKGDFNGEESQWIGTYEMNVQISYHLTPEYRRKVIYNQYKENLRDILKQLCNYKGIQILEGHIMPDHVHMLVSVPPKISISSFMGYLKGKSALMMFDAMQT